MMTAAIDLPDTTSAGATDPDAQLRDAVKVYPDGTVAVDGVSFDVARGEFFSLLGPSGCGKSTTLRMVAGLEPLTSGQVRIRGEEMHDRPAHRRPTNMVFQRLALFPHLTVTDNVAFGPKLKRRSRRQVADTVRGALELVELGGYGHRYPHQLSGGQQQRVAIARALANEPAVLLLDEPLGSLDLRLRIQMQQALKEIQQQSQTTFIYVTHDQTEAMTMSDRVAVMNRGRIEQEGSPDQLYTQPRTRFVATFIGDTNLFDGTYRDGQLDTGDLRLTVPAAGQTACVRPERVAVASELPGLSNIFDGIVADVVFQGPTIRYVLRLGPDRTLVAEHPTNGAEPALRPGDHAQAGFPVEAVVMLTEPPAEHTEARHDSPQ